MSDLFYAPAKKNPKILAAWVLPSLLVIRLNLGTSRLNNIVKSPDKIFYMAEDAVHTQIKTQTQNQVTTR